MRLLFAIWLACVASAPSADALSWSEHPDALTADVVVFGEVHDNVWHHRSQAGLLISSARLEFDRDRPTKFPAKAVVYEMLTPDQATRVTPDLVPNEAALEAALNWNASGWPDFSLYYPIFAARPDVAVYGAAVPREVARAALEDGVAKAFGPDAEDYGLTVSLPPDQQAAQEDLQRSAHCDALPEAMLPGMVDIQRLRDARLAQVTLQALEETGGPVLVITGNGHARADWGVPSVLARVRPDADVFSILQGEYGQAPDGGADLILTDAPAPEREDPCLAFAK